MSLSFITRPALAENESKARWIMGLGTGLGVPNSGMAVAYKVGLSAEADLGYALDDNLSFYLAGQASLFGTDFPQVSLNEYALIPTVKYAVGSRSFKPYLTAGAGLQIAGVQNGASNSSQADLGIQGGIGVDFAAGGKMNVYLEVKYVYVPSAVPYSFFPILAGANFDL